MIKDKTYNGNLNIEQNKISLDTNFEFIKVEIRHTGKMKIQSLLPNGCILEQDKLTNRIVIHIKNNVKIYDLFKYKGKAMIKKCFIVLENNKKINLYINRSNLELWNTLTKTNQLGYTDGVSQEWDYITKNWEDISFDGNNAKRQYTFRKTTYDKEANTFNTITEIRKK